MMTFCKLKIQLKKLNFHVHKRALNDCNFCHAIRKKVYFCPILTDPSFDFLVIISSKIEANVKLNFHVHKRALNDCNFCHAIRKKVYFCPILTDPSFDFLVIISSKIEANVKIKVFYLKIFHS